jgi:hypothetical protein
MLATDGVGSGLQSMWEGEGFRKAFMYAVMMEFGGEVGIMIT